MASRKSADPQGESKAEVVQARSDSVRLEGAPIREVPILAKSPPVYPGQSRLKSARLPPQERVAPASPEFHALKNDLRKGAEVALHLMNGEKVPGIVNLAQTDAMGWLRVGGRLTGNEAGTFSLAYRAKEMHARILLTDRRLAYEVSQAEDGQLQMHERPLSDVVCNQHAEQKTEEIQPTEESAITIPILSSRPGAEAVVYLDFDGETVVDADWAGGSEIVAAPSPQTIAEMEETWARVKEDFSPFNLDITTDPERYASAPVGRRMRVIITPTVGWYAGSVTTLGVAYLRSFARAGTSSFSSTIPCWMFTRPGKTTPWVVADCISHEVGHTLNLNHDGGSGDGEYYRGHGSGPNHWQPIMGGPGTQHNSGTVSQWSKGEYTGANRSEDDLAIITNSTNGFGYVSDDFSGEPVAEGAGSAQPLGINDGIIEQGGMIHSDTDRDCFSFVSPGGYLDINAAPARDFGNLDLTLELLDSDGAVLETVSPDDYRGAALVQKKLAAGTYFIKVRGSGRGDPLAQGYTPYGSLGEYAISGRVSQGYLLLKDSFFLLTQSSQVFMGGKSVDGDSLKRTLTLLNTGDAAVTGLSVGYSGEGAEHFTTDLSDVTTLAAGATVDFDVVFTPTAVGDFTVVLDVRTDQPQECGVTMVAQSIVPTGPPYMILEPRPAIAKIGESVTFNVAAEGGIPRRWQWYKEIKGLAKDIAGATGRSLTLNNLTSADAASYGVRVTNNEGTVKSQTAAIAVIVPLITEINVKEGGSANLTAKAHVPAGYEFAIQYRWSKDGQLEPGDRHLPTLKLTRLSEATAGRYTCQVEWYYSLSQEAVNAIIRVVPRPVLNAITLPDIVVSQEVDETVTGLHFPSSFTATGLPPGISLNKTTGKLTGRPTAAKVVKGVVVPYQVTFSAANATGSANVPVTAEWMVSPLPEGSTGVFNGLVDRHPALNANLGGTIRLTVLPTGNFSGTLKLGSLTHQLKGVLVTPVLGGDTTATVTLPQKGKPHPLTLRVTLAPETHQAVGSVSSTDDGTCGISLWRAVWGAKNPATEYAIKSTAAVIPPALVLDEPGAYPQGEGYLTLSVSTAGIATWAGRMADGSTVTASTTLGFGGRILIHMLLNKNLGSAQGWQVFDKNSQNLDGTLTWLKTGLAEESKTVDRYYRKGFHEHTLQVIGGRYSYTVGEALLGLSDAQIRLEGDILNEPLRLPVKISSKGLALADPNDYLFKPSIKAATGLFSGSFTLSIPEKRVGLFYGALVQRLGRGAGHFLLPEISVPPATTSKTVPIFSGKAVLEPPQDP